MDGGAGVTIEVARGRIILGPDGKPLSSRHVIARHRFVKAEPVRRRARRHAEIRWYCLCGAFGSFLVRPADERTSCRGEVGAHAPLTCFQYRYRAGELLLTERLIVDGHFETGERWAIRGPGVGRLFGDA